MTLGGVHVRSVLRPVARQPGSRPVWPVCSWRCRCRWRRTPTNRGVARPTSGMVEVGGELTTGEQSSVTVTLPVPEGVTPTAVRGRLQVGQDVTDGRIEFRVGERLSRDVPAASATPFDVPLVPGDLGRNRTIDLTHDLHADRRVPRRHQPGRHHLRRPADPLPGQADAPPVAGRLLPERRRRASTSSSPPTPPTTSSRPASPPSPRSARSTPPTPSCR